MKQFSFLLAFALCVSGLNAQKKVEVRESNEKIGGGSNNALTVMIYIDDKDAVEKAWKSKMKDLGAKVSTKEDMFGDDAKTKAMGPNTFDMYARAEVVKGEGIKLIVAVDLGGAFMSSSKHSDQYKVFRDILYEFAVKLTKDHLADNAAVEEKKLSKLEDQQKDLEKDNKDLKGDIEDYKKKIAEAEDKIKKNEEEQKKKKSEIDEQKKTTEAAKQKLNAVK